MIFRPCSGLRALAGAAIVLGALTCAEPSFADEVKDRPSASAKQDLSAPKPHMVGLAKDLVKQLKQTHFKDPETARRALEILNKSRLRSWKAGPPAPKDLDSENARRLASHSAFVEQLGDAFGLLTAKDDRHRETIEALLSATDQKQQRDRLLEVLNLAGVDKPGSEEMREAEKKFTRFMAQSYFDQQTRAGVEVGEDGDRLLFEWDPDRGDFVTRIQPGDGSDEIVLHGGVSVEADGAEPKLAFRLDDDPVTIMDQQRREAVRQAIYGEWINAEDGSRWMIASAEGANEITEGREAGREEDTVSAEISRMKAEVKKLRNEKIHIWINEETGKNTIQYKYQRLKPPFVYMKDLSRNFYKDKIERLEQDIREREASGEILPVDRLDPTGAAGNGKRATAAVAEVSRLDGYQYAYEEVFYDGTRLTGKRTLRDLRDLDHGRLPEGVAEQLISSWSPPEWIELEGTYRPRTDEIVLAGKIWRLHVTSRSNAILGGGPSVVSIQDPYVEKTISLHKAAPAVRLQFVDEANQPFSGDLPFGKPIRIEAEFKDPPDQAKRSVQLSWKGSGPGTFLLEVFRSADRPKVYQSDPFILEPDRSSAADPAARPAGEKK